MVQKVTKAKPKKPMGRPRLHKSEGVTVAFRTSAQVAVAINAAIATIKIVSGESHTPTAMIVIDCLKARLKQLGNNLPKLVEGSLKSLDRALDDYPHVKR